MSHATSTPTSAKGPEAPPVDEAAPGEGDPYDRPEFANAAEFTVKVTYVVAGGKRQRTAARRARKIAARIADHAVRAAGVLDVTAVAGPSRDGEILWASPVEFSRANSGTEGPDGLRDQYLDPEYGQALRSLAAARARETERRQADLRRRTGVGCANPLAATDGQRPNPCRCVYCRPDVHEREQFAAREGLSSSATRCSCLCGQPVTEVGGRCARDRTRRLVVLHGDPDSLKRLARLDDRPQARSHLADRDSGPASTPAP